jgi:hypothetical protein
MLIFVDEIKNLIDMIFVFVIISLLLLIVLFLRGEGSKYGKCNSNSSERKSFGFSDKNFFL